MFPMMQKHGQFYFLAGVDDRMPAGDDSPRLTSNDGMRVTAEEAKMMARMARNYVLIQRSLPEENASGSLIDKGSITRDDLMRTLTSALTGSNPDEKWPQKIRSDFVDKFEQFAEWAERSGGFAIY